jgi:hypothetical protein
MSTVQGGQGNIVTNGLVLNLDAANPRSYLPPYNGTTWFDLSGNSNNGTLTNGPTFNSGNGGSIVFDGVDDYVGLGNILNFERSDVFSINVWVKFDVNTSTQILVSKWLTSGYEIFTLNPGKISWTLANAGGGSNQIRVDSADNTFLPGEILNICTTYNGSSSSSGLSIYKNGVLLNTTSIYNNLTNSILNEIEFRIGILGNSSFPTDGNVYTTQIYNRALSATEILQNFQATRARFGI